MKPETLETAGKALYGPRWKACLARDLGVDPRTVRGWISGKGLYNDPPDRIVPVLVSLLECRQEAICAALGAVSSKIHSKP